MTVTRAVIIDLLPLYLAGEASDDTRVLVEAYLAGDPELAAQVRRGGAELLHELDAAVPPEVELRALRRTRTLLAWQRWLFGLAMGLTAVGATTVVSVRDGRVIGAHLMLRDHPLPIGACLLGAAACWVAYLVLRRLSPR